MNLQLLVKEVHDSITVTTSLTPPATIKEWRSFLKAAKREAVKQRFPLFDDFFITFKSGSDPGAIWSIPDVGKMIYNNFFEGLVTYLGVAEEDLYVSSKEEEIAEIGGEVNENENEKEKL